MIFKHVYLRQRNACQWVMIFPLPSASPHRLYMVETLNSYSSALPQVQWGQSYPNAGPSPLSSCEVAAAGFFSACFKPLLFP